MGMCITILECVLAFFLPPLVVFMERGCGKDLLINIIFTILLWLPGFIHALYIIFKDAPEQQPTTEPVAAPAATEERV
jgi:uncharacterized membrane protein YqaE (UPF0057 family)